MKSIKHKSFGEVLTVSLAIVFFSGNCVMGYSQESNFWGERKKALAENIHLARLLPVPLPMSVPAPQKSAAQHSAKSASSASRESKFPISLQYGTFRAVQNPAGGNTRGTVIFIQDVHMNPEAQANISGALAELLNTKKIDLLLVEGADSRINLPQFTTPPMRSLTKAVADHHLKMSWIPGSLHAALCAVSAPVPMFGVEDAKKYEQNIQAYRDSIHEVPAVKKELGKQERILAIQKSRVFNGELKSFDLLVARFQRGDAPLIERVNFLAKDAANLSEQINLFLSAAQIESALDFKRIEAERTALLSQLLPLLKNESSHELMNQGIAYRTGKISHGEFYGYIQGLCAAHQVNLDQFKSFNAYLRYVLLTEKINAETLLKDIDRLERGKWAQLIRTPEERALCERARAHYLAGKLVDFSMTADEWREYRRLKRTHFYPSFEAFYHAAEARDVAMARNILKAVQMEKASSTAFVAGGFHSEGISTKLLEAGYSVMTFVPRLTQADGIQGNSYLSVFAQEKTPLDKLVQGEKLFLAPKVGTPAQMVAIVQDGLAHGMNVGVVAENQIDAQFHRYFPPAGLHLAGRKKPGHSETTLSARNGGDKLKRTVYSDENGVARIETATERLSLKDAVVSLSTPLLKIARYFKSKNPIPGMGMTSVWAKSIQLLGGKLKRASQTAHLAEEFVFSGLLLDSTWLLPWVLPLIGLSDPITLFVIRLSLYLLSALLFGFSHRKIFLKDEQGEVFDAGQAHLKDKLWFGAWGAMFRAPYLVIFTIAHFVPGAAWAAVLALPLAILLHRRYNARWAPAFGWGLAAIEGNGNGAAEIFKGQNQNQVPAMELEPIKKFDWSLPEDHDVIPLTEEASINKEIKKLTDKIDEISNAISDIKTNAVVARSNILLYWDKIKTGDLIPNAIREDKRPAWVVLWKLFKEQVKDKSNRDQHEYMGIVRQTVVGTLEDSRKIKLDKFPDKNVILVLREPLPTIVEEILNDEEKRQRIKAIVWEDDNFEAYHWVTFAQGYQIPVISMQSGSLSDRVNDGAELAIEAAKTHATLLINPDALEKNSFFSRKIDFLSKQKVIEAWRQRPAKTKDQLDVVLGAVISEFPDGDAMELINQDNGGHIALFRTDLLHQHEDSNDYSDDKYVAEMEDNLYRKYLGLFNASDGVVSVRFPDKDLDKPILKPGSQNIVTTIERYGADWLLNDKIGKKFFEMHARALIRAHADSKRHNAECFVPKVTDSREAEKMAMRFNQIKNQLGIEEIEIKDKKTKETIEKRPKIPVKFVTGPDSMKFGIMVETPEAVAAINDMPIELVDFYKLGLRDLADKMNIKNVVDRMLFKAITEVYMASLPQGKPVGLCGVHVANEAILALAVSLAVESKKVPTLAVPTNLTPHIKAFISVLSSKELGGLTWKNAEDLVREANEALEQEIKQGAGAEIFNQEKHRLIINLGIEGLETGLPADFISDIPDQILQKFIKVDSMGKGFHIPEGMQERIGYDFTLLNLMSRLVASVIGFKGTNQNEALIWLADIALNRVDKTMRGIDATRQSTVKGSSGWMEGQSPMPPGATVGLGEKKMDILLPSMQAVHGLIESDKKFGPLICRVEAADESIMLLPELEAFSVSVSKAFEKFEPADLLRETKRRDEVIDYEQVAKGLFGKSEAYPVRIGINWTNDGDRPLIDAVMKQGGFLAKDEELNWDTLDKKLSDSHGWFTLTATNGNTLTLYQKDSATGSMALRAGGELDVLVRRCRTPQAQMGAAIVKKVGGRQATLILPEKDVLSLEDANLLKSFQVDRNHVFTQDDLIPGDKNDVNVLIGVAGKYEFGKEKIQGPKVDMTSGEVQLSILMFGDEVIVPIRLRFGTEIPKLKELNRNDDIAFKTMGHEKLAQLQAQLGDLDASEKTMDSQISKLTLGPKDSSLKKSMFPENFPRFLSYSKHGRPLQEFEAAKLVFQAMRVMSRKGGDPEANCLEAIDLYERALSAMTGNRIPELADVLGIHDRLRLIFFFLRLKAMKAGDTERALYYSQKALDYSRRGFETRQRHTRILLDEMIRTYREKVENVPGATNLPSFTKPLTVACEVYQEFIGRPEISNLNERLKSQGSDLFSLFLYFTVFAHLPLIHQTDIMSLLQRHPDYTRRLNEMSVAGDGEPMTLLILSVLENMGKGQGSISESQITRPIRTDRAVKRNAVLPALNNLKKVSRDLEGDPVSYELKQAALHHKGGAMLFDLIQIARAKAVMLRAMGNKEGALGYYEEALQYAEEAFWDKYYTEETRLSLLFKWADIYSDMYDTYQTKEDLEKAIRALEVVTDPKHFKNFVESGKDGRDKFSPDHIEQLNNTRMEMVKKTKGHRGQEWMPDRLEALGQRYNDLLEAEKYRPTDLVISFPTSLLHLILTRSPFYALLPTLPLLILGLMGTGLEGFIAIQLFQAYAGSEGLLSYLPGLLFLGGVLLGRKALQVRHPNRLLRSDINRGWAVSILIMVGYPVLHSIGEVFFHLSGWRAFKLLPYLWMLPHILFHSWLAVSAQVLTQRWGEQAQKRHPEPLVQQKKAPKSLRTARLMHGDRIIYEDLPSSVQDFFGRVKRIAGSEVVLVGDTVREIIAGENPKQFNVDVIMPLIGDEEARAYRDNEEMMLTDATLNLEALPDVNNTPEHSDASEELEAAPSPANVGGWDRFRDAQLASRQFIRRLWPPLFRHFKDKKIWGFFKIGQRVEQSDNLAVTDEGRVLLRTPVLSIFSMAITADGRFLDTWGGFNDTLDKVARLVGPLQRITPSIIIESFRLKNELGLRWHPKTLEVIQAVTEKFATEAASKPTFLAKINGEKRRVLKEQWTREAMNLLKSSPDPAATLAEMDTLGIIKMFELIGINLKDIERQPASSQPTPHPSNILFLISTSRWVGLAPNSRLLQTMSMMWIPFEAAGISWMLHSPSLSLVLLVTIGFIAFHKYLESKNLDSRLARGTPLSGAATHLWVLLPYILCALLFPALHWSVLLPVLNHAILDHHRIIRAQRRETRELAKNIVSAIQQKSRTGRLNADLFSSLAPIVNFEVGTKAPTIQRWQHMKLNELQMDIKRALKNALARGTINPSEVQVVIQQLAVAGLGVQIENLLENDSLAVIRGHASLEKDLTDMENLAQKLRPGHALFIFGNSDSTDADDFRTGIKEIQKRHKKINFILIERDGGYVNQRNNVRGLNIPAMEAEIESLKKKGYDRLTVALPSDIFVDSDQIMASSVLNHIRFIFLDQLLRGLAVTVQNIRDLGRFAQVILQQA